MAPNQYPLLFGFQEVILGGGFVAGVKLYGRAVAEQEADASWWIYGVTPGAVAGSGLTLGEAMNDFRDRIKSVFVDCAQEAGSDVESFKAKVEDFFYATDHEALSEWEAARQAVRNGEIDRPELAKETRNTAPTISVVELPMNPSANPIDGERARLAA